MRYIKNILFVVLFVMPLTLVAQVKLENATTLGFGVHGGFAKFAQAQGATNRPGGDAGLNVSFAYSITRNWGIMAGLDFGYSRSFFDIEDVYSYIDETITFGDGISAPSDVRATQVQYYTPKLHECIDMTYLAIPLQVFVQTGGFDFSVAEFHQSFVSLGAKFMLPMKIQASGAYDNTERSVGPYIDGTGTALDEQKVIGTFEAHSIDYDVKASMSSPLMIMACAEVGTMLKVNEHGCLFLSIYGEYQVTPTQYVGETNLLVSDGTTVSNVGYFASNSADRSRYFQMGLRLQYNLFFGQGER